MQRAEYCRSACAKAPRRRAESPRSRLDAGDGSGDAGAGRARLCIPVSSGLPSPCKSRARVDGRMPVQSGARRILRYASMSPEFAYTPARKHVAYLFPVRTNIAGRALKVRTCYRNVLRCAATERAFAT